MAMVRQLNNSKLAMALKLAPQSRVRVVQYPIHQVPRCLPIKDRCHPPNGSYLVKK